MSRDILYGLLNGNLDFDKVVYNLPEIYSHWSAYLLGYKYLQCVDIQKNLSQYKWCHVLLDKKLQWINYLMTDEEYLAYYEKLKLEIGDDSTLGLFYLLGSIDVQTSLYWGYVLLLVFFVNQDMKEVKSGDIKNYNILFIKTCIKYQSRINDWLRCNLEYEVKLTITGKSKKKNFITFVWSKAMSLLKTVYKKLNEEREYIHVSLVGAQVCFSSWSHDVDCFIAKTEDDDKGWIGYGDTPDESFYQLFMNMDK